MDDNKKFVNPPQRLWRFLDDLRFSHAKNGTESITISIFFHKQLEL